MPSMIRLMLSILVVCISISQLHAQDIQVKDGQTIAFLGDSITQFGAHSGCGYVRLVDYGLKANGIEIKRVNAGISGHKSNQMLERLEKDVLSKKPDWLTLSCGVNDVWHGKRGVNLQDYKTNITKIVDQAQAAGIKVMILTSTMIREQADNDLNKKLAPYNDFLRELAKQKNCLLADLNRDMLVMVNTAPDAVGKTGLVATRDGVHMNPLGDEMMAKGILRSFGLSDTQLAKAQQAWRNDKYKSRMQMFINLSIEDYAKLQAAAADKNMTVEAYVSDLVDQQIVK